MEITDEEHSALANMTDEQFAKVLKIGTDKWLKKRRGRNAMPAKSVSQQRFFGAELARKRAGEATETSGMTESQLRDFAKTKTRGLPKHVPKRSHKGAHKRGDGM